MKNLSRSSSRENINQSRHISNSYIKNNQSKKYLNNSVSQISNYKMTISDNKPVSNMSTFELTSTIYRLKSKLAKYILSCDKLELEMKTKLNFLHST